MPCANSPNSKIGFYIGFQHKKVVWPSQYFTGKKGEVTAKFEIVLGNGPNMRDFHK